MKKLLFAIVLIFTVGISFANNVLVQNVTTTGNNATNKTIQVQFDLSWDNSWRDAINWDAAWVFLKFKNASGVWQHAQLNTTGFANGTGTANTMQVTSDKVGCWVYRSALGSGTFNNTTMQLQWNYGLSGLTSVTGLEIRVFAIEMVYVPEGEFNCAKAFNNLTSYSPTYRNFNGPANTFPIINTQLTPTLSYNDGTAISLRIKGDAGIDTDNNGTVDNTTYPIGYRAFYCYKYELTEQQYADFLNTLTSTQKTTLGVAGTGITLSNGQYFSSTPNKACGNSTEIRLLAYADWSGQRPLTLLEFNKVSYGPIQPQYYNQTCSFGFWSKGYPAWGTSTTGGFNPNNGLINVGSYATSNTNRVQSGSSYYGVLDLTGNANEPIVRMNYFSFQNINGDGVLSNNGNADVINWSTSNMITYIDMINNGSTSCGYDTYFHPSKYGFRYVRSAE